VFLARAADESRVVAFEAVDTAQRAAFVQQIVMARSKLEQASFANAWVAGQLLTLREACD